MEKKRRIRNINPVLMHITVEFQAERADKGQFPSRKQTTVHDHDLLYMYLRINHHIVIINLKQCNEL